MKDSLIKESLIAESKDSFECPDDGKTIFEAYMSSDREVERNLAAQKAMEARCNQAQKDLHLERAIEVLKRRGVCSCGR